MPDKILQNKSSKLKERLAIKLRELAVNNSITIAGCFTSNDIADMLVKEIEKASTVILNIE